MGGKRDLVQKVPNVGWAKLISTGRERTPEVAQVGQSTTTVPYLSDASDDDDDDGYGNAQCLWCFSRVGRCRNEWIETTGPPGDGLGFEGWVVAWEAKKARQKKKTQGVVRKKPGAGIEAFSLWHWGLNATNQLTSYGVLLL